MMTQTDPEWLDLLRMAKTIRRSVQPVEPSSAFRTHLRADLEAALSGHPYQAPVIIQSQRTVSPVLVIGACIGLVTVALALIVLRDRPSRRRSS